MREHFYYTQIIKFLPSIMCSLQSPKQVLNAVFMFC